MEGIFKSVLLTISFVGVLYLGLELKKTTKHHLNVLAVVANNQIHIFKLLDKQARQIRKLRKRIMKRGE